MKNNDDEPQLNQPTADLHEIAIAFAKLQAKLPDMWREIGSTDLGGAVQKERTTTPARRGSFYT